MGVRLIVALGALSAIAPLSLDLYLPALPSLARSLQSSASAAQLTLTACLLGLGVGQVLAGPISDVLGRRRPLLLGVGCFAAASFLCALAPSIWALVVLRSVQGLAGAAGIVISRAVVRDRVGGIAAARAFAMLMLVNGLAPVLAPAVGGQLMRVTDWRGMFIALTAVGVALLAASWFWVPETLRPSERRLGTLADQRAVFGRILHDRAFAGTALSSAFAFGSMFAYIAGSPFVLQQVYGLSPQQFTGVFAVNSLGLVASSQLSRVVVRRVAPVRLLGAGVVCSSTGAVLLLVTVLTHGGVLAIVSSLFVVVVSIGLILPNATALAMSRTPDAAGSASAAFGLTQFMVGAGVAPLAGIGGALSALPMALVIVASSGAALTVFMALARPVYRRMDAAT